MILRGLVLWRRGRGVGAAVIVAGDGGGMVTGGFPIGPRTKAAGWCKKVGVDGDDVLAAVVEIASRSAREWWFGEQQRRSELSELGWWLSVAGNSGNFQPKPG
ncbi:hypothetical protein CASFOL_007253 [Castilleja foliolosa]|uniref:Uncharacterized protein n=1 Tax=Castilleja foliolosa TaxID=1961234 RepID=A0ABD3E8Q0_9LAMI